MASGANVFTVGPSKGVRYEGKHGMGVVSDMAIEEATESIMDALIIPGFTSCC